MFNSDREKRITFAEIREHPLFAEYFPDDGGQSRMLYNPNKKNKSKNPDKLMSFILAKKGSIIQLPIQNKTQHPKQQQANMNEFDNATPSYYINKVKTTE